jgi:hypothetical protein
MDVPLRLKFPAIVFVRADIMLLPGAKMSMHDPKLEYDALASFVAVAPTVMALAAEAGDTPQASTFEFPAATATMTPPATALFTAKLRASLRLPPRLMLMTALFEPGRFARATTQSIPAITPAQDPLPSEFRTLTAIKLVFLAIPYLVPPTVPKTEKVETHKHQEGEGP